MKSKLILPLDCDDISSCYGLGQCNKTTGLCDCLDNTFNPSSNCSTCADDYYNHPDCICTCFLVILININFVF